MKVKELKPIVIYILILIGFAVLFIYGVGIIEYNLSRWRV